jgi:hypothetical protein
MSERYPGGFITKAPVAPTALAASGIWSLDQAMQYIKAGTWPVQKYYWIGFMKPSSGNLYATQDGATNWVASNATSFYITDYDGDNSHGGYIQKITFNTQSISYQKIYLISGAANFLTAIAIDSSNNIYTGGYYNGGKSWIVKYDNSGGVTWSTSITSGSYYINSVTTDTSGNVYFAGQTTGTFNYGDATRIAAAKINSSGVVQWEVRYGTSGDSSNSFAPFGIGQYSSSVFIAGWLNASAGSNGVFVSLATSNNALNFEKSYASNTFFTGMALNTTSGNMYVCGQASNNNALIMKIDSSGAKVWGQRLGNSSLGGGFSTTCSIAIDSDENVYVAGKGYSGSNPSRIAVAKYNSSGIIQWQRDITLPSSYQTSIFISLTVNPNGYVVISNQVQQMSPVAYYPFLAVISSAGSNIGTYTFNSETYTIAASSYATSSDTDSFTTTSYGITSQSHASASDTVDVTTSSLTLTTGAL